MPTPSKPYRPCYCCSATLDSHAEALIPAFPSYQDGPVDVVLEATSEQTTPEPKTSYFKDFRRSSSLLGSSFFGPDGEARDDDGTKASQILQGSAGNPPTGGSLASSQRGKKVSTDSIPGSPSESPKSPKSKGLPASRSTSSRLTSKSVASRVTMRSVASNQSNHCATNANGSVVGSSSHLWLAELPSNEEVRTMIFTPHLVRHSLFRLWSHFDHPSFKRLCVEAMELAFLMPGDELFASGNTAISAFILVSGSLSYAQEVADLENADESIALSSHPEGHMVANLRQAFSRLNSHLDVPEVVGKGDSPKLSFHGALHKLHLHAHAHAGERHPHVAATTKKRRVVSSVVTAGAWLSEAALWTDWTHLGTVRAETQCRLVILHKDQFIEASRRHKGIRQVAEEYSAEFGSRLTACHQSVSSQKPLTTQEHRPNDLQAPFTEFGNILQAMSNKIQTMVGIVALDSAEESRVQSAAGLKKLRTEVQQGKSIVLMNADGECERMTSTVVLLVEGTGFVLDSEDEAATGVQCGPEFNLIQIGRWEGAEVIPTCQLYSGKVERGESPTEAVDRIVKWKLPDLDGLLQIEDMEEQVTFSRSKEFGFMTKTFRVICKTRLLESFEMVKCPIRTSPAQGPYLRRSGGALGSGDFNPERRVSAGTRRKRKNQTVQQNIRLAPMDLDPAEMELELGLVDKEVGIFNSGNGATFYAWMSRHEFEFLASERGDAALRRWVATLDFVPYDDGGGAVSLAGANSLGSDRLPSGPRRWSVDTSSPVTPA